MNINPEAYKFKVSDTPSRSMWQLNDIIPIFYIIYSHNFYTGGKPRFSLQLLSVKICAAVSKLWQVQHETNIEIGITFFTKFLLTLSNLIYL